MKVRETDKAIKIPSAIDDLHKRLVAEVKPLHPWYYELSKARPQQALTQLRTAWDRYFKKVSKQPRFKKKGVSGDSFYKEQGTKAKPGINNDGKRVKLPKIGWVRLHDPLPITAFHNCVISRKADRWFITLKYETEKLVTPSDSPTVRIDIGIKELAFCSNGQAFANPKANRRMSRKMKRLQRCDSKRVKGSNNRKKAVAKLAELDLKVLKIRKYAIHKLTTYFAQNHSEVKIEELNVKAFLKNHKLAGEIADCGIYSLSQKDEVSSF